MPTEQSNNQANLAALKVDPGWPRWNNADGQVMVFDGDPLEAVKAGGFDEVRPLMR